MYTVMINAKLIMTDNFCLTFNFCANLLLEPSKAYYSFSTIVGFEENGNAIFTSVFVKKRASSYFSLFYPLQLFIFISLHS